MKVINLGIKALKLNIIFSIIIVLMLNSCQISDKEIHLFIQKGHPLNNYFIQYNLGNGGIMSEPRPYSFKFEYNNKHYRCYVVKEVIGTYMKDSGGSYMNANGRWIDNTSSKEIHITKNYYVLTDTTADRIIIDGFYKFQVMNGTKSKYYIDMFKQMNTTYFNNLIRDNVYTKEEIDNMTDAEKLVYLELN